MRATREQWLAAENPETAPEELARLATIPELQLLIAANPSTYDELLDWLIEYGTPEVRATLDPESALPIPQVTTTDVLVDGPVWELDAGTDQPIEPAR